jgi:hypothetical protein
MTNLLWFHCFLTCSSAKRTISSSAISLQAKIFVRKFLPSNSTLTMISIITPTPFNHSFKVFYVHAKTYFQKQLLNIGRALKYQPISIYDSSIQVTLCNNIKCLILPSQAKGLHVYPLINIDIITFIYKLFTIFYMNLLDKLKY